MKIVSWSAVYRTWYKDKHTYTHHTTHWKYASCRCTVYTVSLHSISISTVGQMEKEPNEVRPLEYLYRPWNT